MFDRTSWEFLQRYSWLCSEALSRQRYTWNFTIKFHMQLHLVDQARYLSPACGWNYGYEDFVGKICRLGKSCLDGRAAVNVSGKILEKYLLAVSIRISHCV